MAFLSLLPVVAPSPQNASVLPRYDRRWRLFVYSSSIDPLIDQNRDITRIIIQEPLVNEITVNREQITQAGGESSSHDLFGNGVTTMRNPRGHAIYRDFRSWQAEKHKFNMIAHSAP